MQAAQRAEEQRLAALKAQEEEHRAKEAQRQAEEAARALSVMMHGSPRQSHAVDFAAAIDQRQAALQSKPVNGELTKCHAYPHTDTSWG